MKEIEANKRAWAQLSREHYETFKKAYEAGEYALPADQALQWQDVPAGLLG